MGRSGSLKENRKSQSYDPVANNGEGGGGKDEIKLEAKMSMMNGVTVIVGSIIGSGIFITPSGVVQSAGSYNASLIVWAVSGLFSMIGAYCYAELGCMIKKSGADYAYIMTTFGPFVAFIRLWIEAIIVRPCSQAVVALTFSLYVLKPFFPDCQAPHAPAVLLAMCCICILAFINCWNVSWATWVQDIFTYAKLLALMVIIGAGMYQLCLGKWEHFTFNGTKTDVSSVAMAFQSGLFAYNGWNYLNFIIEELKDPVRNLPRAIAIACTLVTVVYVLTNVAFYTTLSVAEMTSTPAVAVTFATKLFGYMAWIIPVFVSLSTFGAVNGILLTSSRLFYAGACEGQMPEVLTMIQTSKRTPAPAVVGMALLSMMYLIVPDINQLIGYVNFAAWLSIGLSVFCVPYLRWAQPELERPIKVSLIFPAIYIAATLFIIGTPMIDEWVNTLIGTMMIAMSIPVYFVLIVWKSKPKCFTNAVVGVTKFLQKMMLVVGKPKPAQV